MTLVKKLEEEQKVVDAGLRYVNKMHDEGLVLSEEKFIIEKFLSKYREWILS